MRVRVALALMMTAAAGGMTGGGITAGGAEAQVTNLEAPGNLAPSVDPGCVAMSTADARLSPPDLALGVLACGRAGKWDAAADLYALMLLRVAYDTKRVADASAHQAGEVLTIQLGESLSTADRASLGAALDRFGDPLGPQKAALCQAAKATGAPRHDPSWMMQHGMGAFLGTEGDGLVKGFDADAAWDKLLREDMTCG